jgi:hypothetical protein
MGLLAGPIDWPEPTPAARVARTPEPLSSSLLHPPHDKSTSKMDSVAGPIRFLFLIEKLQPIESIS